MELTPKMKYFQYIRPRNIYDTLGLINEVSYTKKLEIITELNEKYNIVIINKALNKYKEDYILGDRVYIPRLKPTLKNICKRFFDEEEKEKEEKEKKK